MVKGKRKLKWRGSVADIRESSFNSSSSAKCSLMGWKTLSLNPCLDFLKCHNEVDMWFRGKCLENCWMGLHAVWRRQPPSGQRFNSPQCFGFIYLMMFRLLVPTGAKLIYHLRRGHLHDIEMNKHSVNLPTKKHCIPASFIALNPNSYKHWLM